MPSTRDIRRRIKSVKNTAQITKAMQMVASAKMRRAQQAALAGRPYATLMNEVLAAATAGAGEFTHPLMEKRAVVRKRALILITTDKGLCGALNTNLLREAAKWDKDTTVFICAGKKGAQWAGRLKRELAAEFSYKDTPQFAEARAISKFAQDMFLEGKVDAVDVLYTNFINTLVQKPESRQLLPLGEIKALEAGLEGEGVGEKLGEATREYLFEPVAATVLGNLLPHYLNYQVFQFLQEAKASEQSARMVAMKNATDNAKQIIKDLTLEYNKLRQANITKELLEITTAQMAMGN
ncbi:MAG: ATP synthase gamma chain [Limisphaerales bacterium]|nr:MAG: ATP synthase gamma chain [Limisphaerales bacterium]KAG0506991.1 MAG: ATP synthase gamma chain [Limisphaerales bacterium]TXT47969.1 MAG: ATP synthase gamma chain [Limisphaerales bacterium]